MREVCNGWDEIATYIGTSVITAQRYEHALALPVHRRGKGPRPPVYAHKSELDVWLQGPGREHARDPSLHHAASALAGPALQADVINRIHALTNLTLYRRDYRMDFSLRRIRAGIRANVTLEFELVNASDENQTFVQELTIDDADHGHVEEMVFLKNEVVIYATKTPAAFEKRVGHSVYHGRKVTIEPVRSGAKYVFRSSWVINRAESDLWYNHMVLPTLGLSLETHAPDEFEITPSFSTSNLVMPAEHLDVAWRLKK